MGSLPIAELGDLCARMTQANDAVATRLGHWVTTTTDPRLQQLFALAGHRHAWHAELWQSRRPTVPLDFAADAITMPDADGDDARRAAYTDIVERLSESLDLVRQRVDELLDPATARVIALVSADLRELSTLASP